MRPVTICILTFGDHLERLQRALRSIERAIPENMPVVKEIRIVLNACTERVRDWVGAWARELVSMQPGIEVTQYQTAENQFKYPIMRKLFRQPEVTTPYVMWFDDDSYFEDPLPAVWWDNMLSKMADADMLGQIWLMPVQGNQLEWVKTQPWFNPEIPVVPPKRVDGKPVFEFCVGAWWVARAAMLREYDWPVAEIRHNGGDSMLGELLRHQGLRMVRFISGSDDKHDGVRINADTGGRHSMSKRRGHDENRVGWNYVGEPLDTSHQNFELQML